MGEVFLGHDPRLQRRVALKCLNPSGIHGDDEQARVLREARAAARLNHPNIAAVYDVLQQDDRTFIVMELVEGESLAARLSRDRIPLDQVRMIGRQLASALAAAHAQGVIHRDLKPANIHITPDGSIKILDFGVAKLAAAPSAEATDLHPEPTIGGNPGTPNYMAPEQLFGRGVDARSDIYSAGVILYQMATGRRPYGASGAVALAVAMSQGPPTLPSTIHPDLPPDLEAAIMEALEREPENRFQTAREPEIALRLPGERSGSVSSARSVSTAFRPPPRPRPWRLVGALGLVLGVAALIWSVGPELRIVRTPALQAKSTVLAILPAENPTGDAQLDFLSAGISSVIRQNFGSLPGVVVLSRAKLAPYAAKRTDRAAVVRDLGATHILDLSLSSRGSTPRVVARMYGADPNTPQWSDAFEGDVLNMERQMLEEVGRGLERPGAQHRPFTAAEWVRIRKLPTTSGSALAAYSEARALLDRYDVASNIDRAIDLLTGATKTDPQFAIAYAALGDALWRRYQTFEKRPAVASAATAAVMKAIEIDPDDASVYYSLGNMQFLTGRYPDAVRSLQRSLALQPDDDETHRLFGRVLAASGDVEGALAELRRAIDLRPDWNSYYTLGVVLYSHSRYRDALTALQKATELQPTSSDAYLMLGTTYHAIGDLPQAIGNYEHAARLGSNAIAYANLALAYYTAKRYTEARDAYLEAIKRNERKASLRRDLGDVYVRLGRDREARAAYQKAIELAREDLTVNPRDALSVVLIALCEAKIGHRAEAERQAAEAVALEPANRDVRIRVTKVYATLGDRASALDALRNAVALGWEPALVRADDELDSLRALPEFESTIAAGVAARSPANKGAAR